MLGHLSLDIICSEKLSLSLLGTDNVQGQIFQHISAEMATIVYILQI